MYLLFYTATVRVLNVNINKYRNDFERENVENVI